LHGVQGVASSNPAAPTKKSKGLVRDHRAFVFSVLVLGQGVILLAPVTQKDYDWNRIPDLVYWAMESSTSGIQLATQSAWQQFKLTLAERNADRAESEARALRSQADAAQREASRAQESARSLQVEADQAQQSAGEARRGVATIKSVEGTGVRLAATYDRLAQVQTTPVVATASTDTAVNSLGQVTGQVVSVAA
jgi:hypothetical protein